MLRDRGHASSSSMSGRDARSQLFGGARAERLPEAGGAGGGGSGLFGRPAGRGGGAADHGVGSQAMRSALEEDNDRLVSDLERKVAALKGATQSIHDEVTDQNRMLGGMSEDFDRTGGLMGGTLARLDGLVKSAGGSGHVCKLIGFVVVVFLLLYWLLARK